MAVSGVISEVVLVEVVILLVFGSIRSNIRSSTGRGSNTFSLRTDVTLTGHSIRPCLTAVDCRVIAKLVLVVVVMLLVFGSFGSSSRCSTGRGSNTFSLRTDVTLIGHSIRPCLTAVDCRVIAKLVLVVVVMLLVFGSFGSSSRCSTGSNAISI